MPLLTKVEFRGRKAIRLKEIEDTTGLKAGNRADPTRTRLAVAQIQRLYQEKGYDLASVTLLEGGNPGDTKIVIEIFEGPKVKVNSINFVGNHFASSAHSCRPRSARGSRSWALRQVSQRHARRRPAEAHRLLPVTGLFRGQGRPR